VEFVSTLSHASLQCSQEAMAAHDDTTPVMMDFANYSAIETLRDGRAVEIRAQRSQDREGMHAAIARSSSGSLHRRFFAVRREFSEKETDYFLDIDFVNHVALVAVANDGGEPTIVGGGRYVVVQSGQAEVAFAIIDAYQGLGIGSALMRHLATLGREAGLHEFIAEVLSENVPMLNVFERSGLAMSTERDGAVMHVTLRLPSGRDRNALTTSEVRRKSRGSGSAD
jgi:GNAT superfamily N-acetyltransferase